MYYVSKSLIVICGYHHFTHRAANHCCQSLTRSLADLLFLSSISKLKSPINITLILCKSTFDNIFSGLSVQLEIMPCWGL